MAATILIVIVLIFYAVFVLHKKYKDIKAGKFCSCGCDGCSGCSTKNKENVQE